LIRTVNNPNEFTKSIYVNFYNKPTVKKKYKIYNNEIFKLKMNTVLCNFKYDKKKIKIKYKTNYLLIIPKTDKKCYTYIYIFTKLYNYKIKIYLDKPPIKFK
jgi:hypothetical protein